jgi:hypothetical protein
VQSARELADDLVSQAVAAQVDGDAAGFSQAVASLAERPGVSGWERAAGLAIHARLLRSVTVGWHLGWQPAELVRHLGRVFSLMHERLVTDVIAAEMRGYAAAAIDERWAAQLTALGATKWDDDACLVEAWQAKYGLEGVAGGLARAAVIRRALEVVFALATLPRLSQICPPPGTARRAAPSHEGPEVDRRKLDRVRALLAKAESTDFPEEAEALTARAQELMARYSIDEALLAATAGALGNNNAAARRLFLDNPHESAKAMLLGVVASANRCRSIWHSDLGLGTILGFPADLVAVDLLFTSLLAQATSAMVRAGARRDAHGRSRTSAFRQSFLTSYAQRVGERLAQAAAAAQRHAADETGSQDLLPVLAARSALVDAAVSQMFPELTTHAVGAAHDREGWVRGRAAADLATLLAHHELAGDAA